MAEDHTVVAKFVFAPEMQYAPGDYIEYQKKRVREKVACSLVDYVYEQPGFEKMHFVISLFEGNSPFEYRFGAVISLERTQHEVFPEAPKYDKMSWQVLSASAIDEIRNRVRRWFRRHTHG